MLTLLVDPRTPLRVLVYPLFVAMLFAFPAAADSGKDSAAAVTTGDASIPSQELSLLLVPLTKDELLIEAKAWQDIVRGKAMDIARAEIAVLRQNQEMQQDDEISANAENAKKLLQDAVDKVKAATTSGDVKQIAEAQAAVDAVRERMREVEQAVDAAIDAARKTSEMQQAIPDAPGKTRDETGDAARIAQDAVTELKGAIGSAVEEAPPITDGKPMGDGSPTRLDVTSADVERAAKSLAALDAATAAIEQAKADKAAEKVKLLERVTELREERTLLIDNLDVVVDALETKVHKDDSDTLAVISDYRRYIRTVSGIHVDVTDTTSAWVSLKGWVMSREGGLRWIVNLASFVSILVVAWFVARFLSHLTRRAMQRIQLPVLLEEFLIKSVRWVVMAMGIIWSLSALEVSIGPLLALVGAAGFILAFAMQDSLSNFASGLMILFFRPFDTGDVVDAGGVSGKVSSMNLVATTIRTFDNKLMVVPNSKIWSDVITNATGVTQRRVDMEFGIGYSDDSDLAQQILEDIVSKHPKTLKEPEPVIRLHTLADSSVNFICRPWATPEHYWDVYWDITREVKRRFDEAGIGIPFPQRDVHLYIEKGHPADSRATAAIAPAAGSPPRKESSRDESGLDT
jgi:small conductance mechanosensitive channel